MDWVCSGCGRHFNWSVSECPHCRFQTTVTTNGTQPASDNTASAKLPADIKEKFQRFVDEQISLPSSFAKIVNEHFWDLI